MSTTLKVSECIVGSCQSARYFLSLSKCVCVNLLTSEGSGDSAGLHFVQVFTAVQNEISCLRSLPHRESGYLSSLLLFSLLKTTVINMVQAQSQKNGITRKRDSVTTMLAHMK